MRTGAFNGPVFRVVGNSAAVGPEEWTDTVKT
jgi:hypothetical protein